MGGGKSKGKKGGERNTDDESVLEENIPTKEKEVQVWSLKHQRQMIKQWNDKNEMKRRLLRKQTENQNSITELGNILHTIKMMKEESRGYDINNRRLNSGKKCFDRDFPSTIRI